jgi:hypothetical protein
VKEAVVIHVAGECRDSPEKVFWFFFSKKNRFLAASPRRIDSPLSRRDL